MQANIISNDLPSELRVISFPFMEQTEEELWQRLLEGVREDGTQKCV